MIRWRAEIKYNISEDTFKEYQTEYYEFEEFVDLGDIIENGPDWNTIENINIKIILAEKT